jgi:hypothetical protein
MRASIVIAASLIGLVAGAACARAADLAVEPDDGGYDVCCGVAYDPVPQVVIYDDDPGVVVRRWWLPPWRNRHYYPHGRVSLKSRISHPGRRSRAAPRSGPRYVRYWTNPQADVTPLIDPEYVPLPPRRYPYRPPPPVAAP